MFNKKIYLIGVGNYTEVILELAQDCGYTVAGFYHYNNDRTGEIIMGVPILGCTDDLLKTNIKNKQLAVTVGNNRLRNTIATKLRDLGALTPTLIHPRAAVSKSAKLGQGCFIHLNAKISTQSTIGNDCVVDFSGLVGHHVTLGQGCYLASFSMVGSYCTIGNRVLFGMNSLVLPLRITIGEDCVVGAKANVTKSFPEKSILVGNPARKITK